MKTRSYYTKKNAIYGLVAQVLKICLSFISRTIFINLLGSEYLGLNGLFTNVLSMLSLAELGIGGAITFSLYRPLSTGDNKKIQALMRLYRNAYLVIGIVIGLIGVGIIPMLPHLVNFNHSIGINYYYIYILFLADTVSTYFFSAYRRSILQAGQQEYIVTNITSVFDWIVTLGQMMILLVTHNYYLYLIVKTLINILKNKIIAYVAGKSYPCINEKSAERIQKDELREIIKNIYALALSKIGTIIYYSIDNIVISAILGTILVGYYSNYYLIVYSVTSVIGIVLGSAKASIGNLNVTGKPEYKLSVFNKIQFINFMGYGIAAVCLCQLLSPFVALWIGVEYVLDVPVVYTIVVNFLITGLLHTVTMFKDACGLFWQTRYRTIATSVVNVVVSIVLAKYLGLSGVFLGTIVSYVMTILPRDPVILFNEIFQAPVKNFYAWYFKSIGITCIVYAIIHFLCSLIPGSGWINFSLQALVTISVSGGLFVLVSLRQEELRFFLEFIKKFMAKKS